MTSDIPRYQNGKFERYVEPSERNRPDPHNPSKYPYRSCPKPNKYDAGVGSVFHCEECGRLWRLTEKGWKKTSRKAIRRANLMDRLKGKR